MQEKVINIFLEISRYFRLLIIIEDKSLEKKEEKYSQVFLSFYSMEILNVLWVLTRFFPSTAGYTSVCMKSPWC